MKTKAYSITEGSIWKSIISFAGPIILGMFFQQLYNTCDAIMVGQYVGKEALAAVGGGTGFFINLLLGFCGGLASGANIIIAQFFGAKNHDELSRAVHTSFILAIALGIIVTIAGISLAETAMNVIKTPADIYDYSVEYLRIFFAGVIPMFLYNMGGGIIRAIGDSRTPFFVLVIACFVNIGLDYLFVAIFGWGVAGVAWATVISQVVSMILIFIPLIKSNESYAFRFSKLRTSPHLLKKMIKLGVPSGLYSTMYTISNLIMMTFVNAFPTATIAAWTAWGKLDALFWMTVSSLGMAISTFTGQNYGAKKYDRIKKGAWQGLLLTLLVTGIIIIIFRLFGKTFYGLFVPGETEVIDIGMKILLFITPAFFLYVPNEIFANVVGGVGKTYVSMIITFLGICCTRLVWLFGFCQGFTAFDANDFIRVITCYPISWLISATMFFSYYKWGKWIARNNSGN